MGYSCPADRLPVCRVNEKQDRKIEPGRAPGFIILLSGGNGEYIKRKSFLLSALFFQLFYFHDRSKEL